MVNNSIIFCYANGNFSVYKEYKYVKVLHLRNLHGELHVSISGI